MGRAVTVAARLDALWLALLLPGVRPAGPVPRGPLPVPAREVEQAVQGTGVLVDVSRRVTRGGKAIRHGVEPQIARLDVGHLVPIEGAGHARIWGRTHRVARSDRAV